RVLEPAREAATDAVAERVAGEYEDYAALADFVRGLDCCTFEFENVPVATARWLAERVPVFPSPAALGVAQDRVAEKEFFARVGETAYYPLVENEHRRGILRRSLAPAPNADRLQAQAEGYAAAALAALDYVGVLAIEFFAAGGRLLANEMAPRVHNSGHWTIEGAVTSQFENHLRAVLGLPLGSTGPAGHCAMLNLIGELPESAEVFAVPDTHLHLYGKSPRPGRKLGHVTLRAASPERLALRLSELPAFFHRPD